jgi:hypothetical protein
MPMPGARCLAPLVASVVSLTTSAGAETLEVRGDAWGLGELDLSTPHALRALVPVDGPSGAFRFDGNSNWLEAEGGVALVPADGVAVGAWLSLASPPGDTAAILYLGEDGLLFGLNRWRQPEIRLGGLRAAGDAPLPVGDWVHLAGDYDGETLRLRVDGEMVAEVEGEAPDEIAGLFAVGRALDAGFQQDTHPLGAVNGILGEITFRRAAEPVTPGPRPEETPELGAPDIWFADDPDRPRSFPLGETGWANEPHALAWRDGLWHLYFQANPNGAFWRDIVWGHQVSDDLASWENRRPALMPSTGFDRRGVWVGNWIPDREPPSIVYTGVNGDWAGIGLAEAGPDGSLTLVEVVDHDTDPEFQDMRDPWVIRTDDGWLMLIGTGAREGREALLYSYHSRDGETWERKGLFDAGDVQMPGQYWELPVLLEVGDRWMLMGTPVVEGVPARTLYWLGDFDGTRFLPDEPEPRQLDILATYRAPSLARGPEDELVAVGILADEIRDEQERHEAGWVHVLTPATTLELCDDEPRDLCHGLAPALAASYRRTLDEGGDTSAAALSTDGQPVLLTAGIDTSEGGVFRLGVRVTAEGEPAAELTVDAGSGVVRLDYTRGPILPIGRLAVIQGMVPAAETLELELLIDGAAVFGSVNGRPLAFLAFAASDGRDGIWLSTEDGARIESFRLAARE